LKTGDRSETPMHVFVLQRTSMLSSGTAVCAGMENFSKLKEGKPKKLASSSGL